MSAEGTVLITMAGRSRRFRDAGVDAHKATIEVNGATLFAWSLASVRHLAEGGAQIVCVLLQEDDLGDFTKHQASLLGLTAQVLEIPIPTAGQAATVAAGISTIADDGPLYVWNTDTFVTPGLLPTLNVERADGLIPCFTAKAGNQWSFARVAPESDRVVEVAEKRRISDRASVGFYAFSCASQFEDLYWRHRQRIAIENHAEEYVCPIYQEAIDGGQRIEAPLIAVRDVVVLGTPAELRTNGQKLPPSVY